MREYLLTLLDTNQALTWEEMLLHILMAAILAGIIYLSYFLTHTGSIYSRKFNVSLVMLTLLTTTVMAVIGNNVAMSLGMVGALSIVRFRTAIKDSRDSTYIFWAIVAGICCGAGDYFVGALGSAAVFFALLVLGRVKNDERLVLIVRGAREKEQSIESFVFLRFGNKASLRVKNTTESSVELIYELSRRQYDKAVRSTKGLMEKFYEIGQIDYINVVAQSDELI